MTQAARNVRPNRTPGARDVVARRARLLLVGINPSLRSGEIGHHFAGPGNPFWRLLREAGLTGELLSAEEDQRLAEFGIGLTNLCPRPTRSAVELTREERADGCARLERTVARMRPAVVGFVGVSLYADYARWRSRNAVSAGSARGAKPLAQPGPGEKPDTIAGAKVFVVPNPSGLNASFPGFKDKLIWFRALREFTERSASARAAEKARRHDAAGRTR